MAYGYRGLRSKRSLALAVPFFLCCVAAAQTVTTNRAAGVDFTKYRTYRWVEVKGQHPDPNIDAQIKAAVESQLATKNLTKTDGPADLNVDYQVALSTVQTWQAYEDWSDNSPMGQRLVKKQMVTINKGTLALDIYDTSTKHLVWTGQATKTIDLKSSREDRQKVVDAAAKNLLVSFP